MFCSPRDEEIQTENVKNWTNEEVCLWLDKNGNSELKSHLNLTQTRNFSRTTN